MERVQVDKCSIQFEVRALRPSVPPRGIASIMTITEEFTDRIGPAKFEVVEVFINPAIYEILRDSQTRRFFSDKSINDIHDPAALTAMNKKLAELVIECGQVTKRITEKGQQ